MASAKRRTRVHTYTRTRKAPSSPGSARLMRWTRKALTAAITINATMTSMLSLKNRPAQDLGHARRVGLRGIERAYVLAGGLAQPLPELHVRQEPFELLHPLARAGGMETR